MPARLTPPGGFKKANAIIERELRLALRDSMSLAEREVKRRYTGPTSRGGEARLGVRTDVLRTSARGREVKGGPPPVPIEARFYAVNPPKYAHAHENGAVITPRSGKYLAIPLPGATGNTASRRSGVRIRDFPGGFFYRSARGKLLYARRYAKAIQNLFVLVTSVVIPKRPVWQESARSIAPAVEARNQTAIARIVGALR
jgi:hypothetical protein